MNGIVYTEKSTSRLYEVQLFENFALVRPITPGTKGIVEKLDHKAFEERFDDYWGDPDLIFSTLEGEISAS